MKIVILADPLDNQYAGIHVYTHEFIRALARYDKQNEYILIRQKNDKQFPEFKQVVVPNLPLWTGFQVLRFFVIFPFIIRRLKADAVIEPAHFGPFNLPIKIKRITVIHDLTPILFPEYHRWYSQTLQRIFLKNILQKARLIITNSDHTSKDVNEFIPGSENKTARIYLGKDAIFKPEQRKDVIEKYTLDQAYFLFTGTIEPRKNLPALLKAYTIFRNHSGAAIRLIIIGKTGWKAQAFFDELSSHPFKHDIMKLGYVGRDELPTLYSMALAFIYPSFYEGFGLPVVEAMACGAPCILSDTSSLPEVGGDAALYFPPGDFNTLAQHMSRVARNAEKVEIMKKKSLARASRFSWKTYAEQFMTLIQKMN